MITFLMKVIEDIRCQNYYDKHEKHNQKKQTVPCVLH